MNNIFTGLISIVTLFFMLCFPLINFAQEPVSMHKRTGVAIDSHDTVAYHDPVTIAGHQAHKGKEPLTVEWKGAIWRFRDENNRDAFLTEPEKYAPAYNGHCANALSLGKGLLKTDGTHWEIFDDQLYLFYAKKGRKRWNDSHFKTYKVQTDAAWQKILDSL